MAWMHPDETKAGNAIGVPLNETACQILRKQQGLHKRWVFVHTRPAYRSDGTKTAAVRKMRTDSNKAWKGALKRAGISNFRFHDLRHTWASWLVQSGVSLLALKEMGGWETLEMVQRYAHLSAGHLTEHASKIDAIRVEFYSCSMKPVPLRRRRWSFLYSKMRKSSHWPAAFILCVASAVVR